MSKSTPLFSASNTAMVDQSNGILTCVSTHVSCIVHSPILFNALYVFRVPRYDIFSRLPYVYVVITHAIELTNATTAIVVSILF